MKAKRIISVLIIGMLSCGNANAAMPVIPTKLPISATSVRPYVAPTPNEPGEVISLGVGTVFSLFVSDYKSVSGADIRLENGDPAPATISGRGGVVYASNGADFKGKYSVYNSAPVINKLNGTVNMHFKGPNSFLEISEFGISGTGNDAIIKDGPADIEYIPKPGLLKGVKTKVVAVCNRRGSNVAVHALVKYMDGETEKSVTVQNINDTSKSEKEIYDLLPIGTFENLVSVTLQIQDFRGSYFVPSVRFEVVNENLSQPDPVLPKKTFVQPNIATVTPPPAVLPPSVQIADTGLYINEICAKNTKVKDYYGEYYDWIELYNNSDDDIELNGYYISNNADNLEKYQFKNNEKVPSKGYLVIIASDARKGLHQGNTYTGFNVPKDGKTFILSDPYSKIIDIMNVPALQDDMTFSRIPNGGSVLKITEPTKGIANDDTNAQATFVDKPVFSKESGFYETAFDLELSAQGEIYYTLDGSTPMKNPPDGWKGKSLKYENEQIRIIKPTSKPNYFSSLRTAGENGAISPEADVDKIRVVRAAAFDENGNPSEVVTKTYFVGYDMNKDFANSMVVSVTTDEHNLWDEWDSQNNEYKSKYGILTYITGLGTPSGRDWERNIHLDMFERDGSHVIGQNAGIRLKGFGSSGYKIKSFAVYARSEYGAKTFDYPIFEDKAYRYDGSTVDSFKTFQLRSGSQNQAGLKYRDAMHQQQSKDIGTSFEASRPCALFLNGEYWGVYYVQERVGDHYVEEHYNVPADDVLIYKNNEGTPETSARLNEARAVLANADFSTEEGRAQLARYFDLDDLMTYYAANLISLNKDWGQYNHVMWRSRYDDHRSGSPYEDGKWRFLMYDMDQAFLTHNERSNMWGHLGNVHQHAYLTSMKKDVSTRSMFVNTFFDAYSTACNPYNTINELVYWYKEFEPLIPKTNARWGFNANPGDLDAFYPFVVGFTPDYVKALKDNFSLTGDLTYLNVRVNDNEGGTVKVNSITPDFKYGSYTGMYMTDFTTTLTASPNTGYKFVGWQVSDKTHLTTTTGLTTNVSLNINGSRVTAVFAKIANEEPFVNFDYKDGEAVVSKAAYNATGGDLDAKLSFYNGQTLVDIGASERTPVNAKTVWTAGGTAETSSAWEIRLDTEGYKDIYFSASQKSTKNAPNEWKLAYKIGDGPFIDIDNSTKVIASTGDDNTYNALQPSYQYISLPSAMDDKSNVTLRVYMASDSSANGTVSANDGNTSINNISFYGTSTGGIKLSYSGGKVTVSGANEFSSVTAIAASYDGETLNNIALLDIALQDGTGFADLPEGFYGSIKIILVNNTDLIMPLCKAAKIFK